MAGYVEAGWAWLLNSWPYSEHLFFCIGMAALLEFVFIAYNVPLYFAHKYGWWQRYRIHPSARYPEADLVKECLTDHFINSVCLRWLMGYFLYIPIRYIGGLSAKPQDLPSAPMLLFQLVACVMIDDTWFYWAHRLFHTRALYARFHKKHHRFRIAIGLCSEYCHPVEDLLVNTTSTIIGPCILRTHMAVFWLYGLAKLHQTIESHSGYVFPFPYSIWSLGGIMENGRHEFHHSQNVGNYGGVFMFWDYLMGTDRAYNAWCERRSRLGAHATIPPACRFHDEKDTDRKEAPLNDENNPPG